MGRPLPFRFCQKGVELGHCALTLFPVEVGIPGEHLVGLVTRQLHDNDLIYTSLDHIGVEGVPEIVQAVRAEPGIQADFFNLLLDGPPANQLPIRFGEHKLLPGSPIPLRFNEHVLQFLDGIEILKAGKSYSIGDVSFTTPIQHIHPVETYGMIFRTATGHTFSYITDSRFFDALCHSYEGELLIINVVFAEPRPPIDHLSVPDAKLIIGEIRPKIAILTHFGMAMWRARPGDIAQRLSQETGVRVLAARDGMRVDLSQLDSINPQ